MKVSIVIPTYNSKKTISKCLDPIIKIKDIDIEIIVVDDLSDDKTLSIAKKYPINIIELEENKGPANARYIGEKKAKNDIIVFIDSDIVIVENTIRRIITGFEDNSDISAIVGLFSKKHPNNDFYSNYKNLYMNYIFNKCSTEIDFLFGSIFAIKKGLLEMPDISKRFGEDTESGLRLNKRGHKIILDKDLEVIHLKQYDLQSILRNDYIISYHFTRIFLGKKGWREFGKKKRFSHARMSQILSIPLAYLIIISLAIFPKVSALLFLVYIYSYRDFFTFLYREKGLSFVLKSILFTLLDLITMGVGIISGIISFVKTPPHDHPDS